MQMTLTWYMSVWCDKNKLTLNTIKSECMLHGLSSMLKKTVAPGLNLKVQHVKFYKYFRVILDPSLDL